MLMLVIISVVSTLITGLIWQREGKIKELRVYTKDRPWNLSCRKRETGRDEEQ